LSNLLIGQYFERDQVRGHFDQGLLAAVGLPMLLMRMADNQQMNIEGWTRLGAGLDLDDAAHLAPERLQRRLQSLFADGHLLNRLSQQAYRAVDGLGAQRLAQVLSIG
jgi:UDP-N-acetylglucosamine:LPS N-acetylglucosamine transferase